MPKTLHDIAPTWAAMLETGTLASNGINLAETDKCVVGEAYGFESDYSCGVCTNHGLDIWLAAGEYYDENGNYKDVINPQLGGKFDTKELERTLEQFVKHWNEEHA